ncbi:TusE/DsrC/DsvC family sulfur relay protein [Thiobacillus sp.]
MSPLAEREAMPPHDEEGYLLEPNDWSRALAELLADKTGLVLSPSHWRVIEFIRAWYKDTESVPEARMVIKHIAGVNGDKRAAKQELYALFPHGYGQQACRIAGMRKPLKLMLDV